MPVFDKGPHPPEDCTQNVTLDAASKTKIRFILWCGVREGRVSVVVRPGRGQKLVRFGRRLSARGAGATARSSCTFRHGTISCSAQKTGPVVLSGWFTVGRGQRCRATVRMSTAFEFRSRPLGCPDTYPPRPPSLGKTLRFREALGLDLDLRGDRVAIDHRIEGLQRAWRRGNAVARWSASTVFALLRPIDAWELENRERELDQVEKVIPQWVEKHAPSTYAGWDIEPEKYGGIIFVGFTEHQAAQLEALKREVPLIAPGRIEPFPVEPTYTIGKLESIFERGPNYFGSKLSKLISSVGVNVLGNRVEIGTEHVLSVRKLLAERFGAGGPFLVVFERASFAASFGPA